MMHATPPAQVARPRLPTINGLLRVSWAEDDPGFAIVVEVPPNTEALLQLPSQPARTLGPGRHAAHADAVV